ncbi:hypothetical protein ACF1BP_27850 [Streptomyces sp. NPDC014735]|uniref:hypothetical protein n=1 Tax=unclassified Streptomyces TaxID=2593676 RepID=UPI0037002CF6
MLRPSWTEVPVVPEWTSRRGVLRDGDGSDDARLEILGKALHARFRDRLPARTLTGAASLAMPGMLFEIEAVAVRPAPRPDTD